MSRLSRLPAATLLIISAATLALVLTACGGDPASGGGGADMTLTIAAPDDEADVSVPFTVEFDSSESLGPTETGAHHVHVYFDGDDSDYIVVEQDSVEITDLPSGEHVVNASLRNADHSPAGVETEITVTVGAGGTGTEEPGNGGIDY